MPLVALSPISRVPPDCYATSDLCRFVWDHTKNAWLASSSYWVIIKPGRILLIILVAIIARYLLRRAIKRLIRRTAQVSMTKTFRSQATSAAKAVADAIGNGTAAVEHAVGARKDIAAEPGGEGGPPEGEGAAAPPASAAVLAHIDPAVLPERRRQRAEAIGSVLLSFATAVVFSIAGLMILAELGIQLAPLLASAGIAGIALGFGAQTLVKDLLAGLFMLLEDQYGVGDTVDLGEASGVVETVGLRITSIRDPRGVLWHVRNGEIVRVGNKSQGWSLGVLDVPVGFARVDDATGVLEEAARGFAADPQWAHDLIEPPAVLGVERVSVDGAVIRVTVKTTTEAQGRVGRELRTRLTAALGEAGILDAMTANRFFIRSSGDDDSPTGGGTPPI